jgi:hypothetical protein
MIDARLFFRERVFNPLDLVVSLGGHCPAQPRQSAHDDVMRSCEAPEFTKILRPVGGYHLVYRLAAILAGCQQQAGEKSYKRIVGAIHRSDFSAQGQSRGSPVRRFFDVKTGSQVVAERQTGTISAGSGRCTGAPGAAIDGGAAFDCRSFLVVVPRFNHEKGKRVGAVE